MNTKNIIATFIWLSSLLFWLFFSNVFFSNANPDYVCTKSIVWQPCEITSTSCWARQTNHTRSCYQSWTRIISKSYFRTRTDCEAGRSQARWGWYTSWASWRKTQDVYHTESCSVSYTEVDNDLPTR